MPRANRYFLPNHVWHITHRCHKKEFLLKFAQDRKRWRYWLFEARKRYGLCVLNYVVTSNHVHLLVRDRGDREIARSMQLIAGRVAQEFNKRKERKGAFWEDRYHATAVDTGAYLARCMAYIDLNMVRTGVVEHPGKWSTGGYVEIQQPPTRYAVIDQTALLELFGFSELGQLQQACRDWVDDGLRSRQRGCDRVWSESLAVGRPEFVDTIKAELGRRGVYRESVETDAGYVLREPVMVYRAQFGSEMASPREENAFLLG
jgi:putative transposase